MVHFQPETRPWMDTMMKVATGCDETITGEKTETDWVRTDAGVN